MMFSKMGGRSSDKRRSMTIRTCQKLPVRVVVRLAPKCFRLRACKLEE